MKESSQTFYEFFAGGGMARVGLGPSWYCVFANEICEKKAAAYRLNHGAADELKVEDVAKLTTANVPSTVTLTWASFPCQDLSLAGNGKGLKGSRSGTFVPFWELMKALNSEGRGMPLIVLENVVGAITANKGRDFRTILENIVDEGYRVGAMVIDAVRFVPQSRPRLFILAVRNDIPLSPMLTQEEPSLAWHNNALRMAHEKFSDKIKESWVWWKMPEPPKMTVTLTELIDDDPEGVVWHTPQETKKLLGMMSDVNLKKLRQAQAYGKRIVGTVYKRIRVDEKDVKVQRAEVRFDQISGCLRTPVGGSSRQLILVVKGKSIRSRLLAPREAARLMGAPENYHLPERYNDAYFVMGDGLVVPVVGWLEKHLLGPLAHIAKLQTLKVA